MSRRRKKTEPPPFTEAEDLDPIQALEPIITRPADEAFDGPELDRETTTRDEA
ncbi:MAG: hypothetical protein M0Z65_00890 [Firmicutes bacterium]|uniref:Uncharacterized protein n=1 Tax=Melghirimyces thermohalophilus TaxID=1236220 RepID=A0A1G6QCZ2_9BACL|nr:hypothetical protein [Melghirimyces thermohalophilus]MDA8351755.1 hypothetical protein [Bacillota bacterium]SDC90249.1 hypothetical protein SAMN04488112_1216 [Melghirimyces thermohalophilus]